MNTIIFTYDKPTKPGLYLLCNGDVLVPQNMQLQMMHEAASLDMTVQGIVDSDGINVAEYGRGWQFARLELKAVSDSAPGSAIDGSSSAPGSTDQIQSTISDLQAQAINIAVKLMELGDEISSVGSISRK